MEDLLQFLGLYEAWIYALLGVVGIVYFRKLLVSWQEWRTTTFGLERESAQRKLNAALSIVILLALIAAAQFVLVSFVSPVYPVANALLTPTIDLLATPTATMPVSEAAEQPNATMAAPTESAVVSGGCVPGTLDWTFPTEGAEISGVVMLEGTVNITNLGFYKYEFSEPGTDTWTTIAAGNQAVTEAELGGSWNTTVLVPGDYRLRLAVTDHESNFLPACEITVRVVPPQEE